MYLMTYNLSLLSSNYSVLLYSNFCTYDISIYVVLIVLCKNLVY